MEWTALTLGRNEGLASYSIPDSHMRIINVPFLFPLNLSFPAISIYMTPSSTCCTPHIHNPFFLSFNGLTWPVGTMTSFIHPSLNEEQIQLQVL